MAEISEQDKFIEFIAESNNIVALRLKLVGLKGWPDFSIMHNNQIFFIEFKDGDNTLSYPQKHWRKIIEKLGFRYYVVYSCSDAKTIVQNRLNVI